MAERLNGLSLRLHQVEALRAEGLSFRAIADIFGVTRQRVEQVYARQKNRARLLLNNAVNEGRIYKPGHCFGCFAQPDYLAAHHDDYSKPLNVRWLCRKCHGRVHSRKLEEVDEPVEATA